MHAHMCEYTVTYTFTATHLADAGQTPITLCRKLVDSPMGHWPEETSRKATVSYATDWSGPWPGLKTG